MGNKKYANFQQKKKPLLKCEYNSNIQLTASLQKDFHAFHKVQDWFVKVKTNNDANLLLIEVCHFSRLHR
jgi:hypothetical protein